MGRETHDEHQTLGAKRTMTRLALDALPDFSADKFRVEFRQSFVALEADETFFFAPEPLVESCRRLLTLELDVTVAQLVRDNVTVRIGCNVVAPFALVSGGRDRTLFVFRCVYDGCPAFLDVRKFAGADKLKWVIVGVSHCHGFSVFPSRMPRNTFDPSVLEQFNDMISSGRAGRDIEMSHNVLCSKHVFQNAVRNARAETRQDQARAVRDLARGSRVWSSEIHLSVDNVFVEAFFANAVLLARGLVVKFVYVDDTSCSNDFSLPLVSVLCRDLSDTIHSVAWAVLKNRTTETFTRFFSFVARFFPSIETFMCDRHFAQQRGIVQAFGPAVHVFHCCIHVARNIANNTGQSSNLARDFWNMRYARTGESEAKFMTTLNKVHNANRSTFTTHLVNSVDSFLPSRVDPFLKQQLFPELDDFKGLVLRGPFKQSPAVARVLKMVNVLLTVQAPETDIFSLDNTNTIEGYFSTIKGRLPQPTRTLVDVYAAINFTEERALAQHNPSQPMLPERLIQGLSFVLSRDVQMVMSLAGVRSFLRLFARTTDMFLNTDMRPEDSCEKVIFDALENGTVIGSFGWMPDGWVLSREEACPVHNITHSDSPEDQTPVNFLMRLERFMGIANRNVEVFNVLNECLTTLYSVTDHMTNQNVFPANFAFFNKELSPFSSMSETNKDCWNSRGNVRHAREPNTPAGDECL